MGFKLTASRLMIKFRDGRYANGRIRYRFFSLRNIKPDADPDALLTLANAAGKILPPGGIVRVKIMRKYVFDKDAPNDATLSVCHNPEEGMYPRRAGTAAAKPKRRRNKIVLFTRERGWIGLSQQSQQRPPIAAA
jgi:hypothetical protein